MEESQFKEESYSTMPTTTSQEAESKKLESNTTAAAAAAINDGASIHEVVPKPRGRPPGSKNKRKQPVFVTKEPDPSPGVSPYVLQVAGGSDIIASVKRICISRNTGLCVLSGSGLVSNVCFRQPGTTNTITFRGVFNLLSISATVLPPSSATQTHSNNNDFLAKFVISVAGAQGQIFGGAVAGQLISAGTVYIIATSFNNPLYHVLPMELEDIKNSGGNCASISATREQLSVLQQPPHLGGGGGVNNKRHHAPPSTSSMSANSVNPPSNILWQPIPHPHSKP